MRHRVLVGLLALLCVISTAVAAEGPARGDSTLLRRRRPQGRLRAQTSSEPEIQHSRALQGTESSSSSLVGFLAASGSGTATLSPIPQLILDNQPANVSTGVTSLIADAIRNRHANTFAQRQCNRQRGVCGQQKGGELPLPSGLATMFYERQLGSARSTRRILVNWGTVKQEL